MTGDEATGRKPRSPWGDAWRRLRRERLAMVCLAIIALYLLAGLAAETGLLAGDHSQTFQGKHYEEISIRDAFGHFGWLGQTLITGSILFILACPWIYLSAGPTRRFLVGLGVAGAAALAVAGILHAALAIPQVE
ncbi:MAG: hypothetical protein L0216_18570, partial [Planctomycetales bacterium]|nr:hypothetical protein [Planctomycetales bacterium]